ncbi:MAG: HEAT repeat domain-containing protein [Pirellulales bacterium]|mgnify:CR=1 FL=1|jgi:HEAT repeat protein|nr:HEAT repeat domain-containing protein [Thermoguttaceae bacterium]MDD4786843.1 HEAT repeat domain-containing protein [Pirellulales bacterium]MDI9446246.1 HEAT repeat domain-containing protein [Planctomycetota bacterium]NLZ03030.1 hypothetical protein [Pirellulaceae bacterium]
MITRFQQVSVIAAIVLLMAAAPAILPGQGSPARAAEAAKLIGILQSDAEAFDKAKACQRLALVGGREAVPALAALLADEKLGTYARFGLEPIPDPSVDDALRSALGRLQGQLLVGVINSIGVRRDEKAVGALARLVDDSAPEVAPKALAALGQIASAEATEALKRAVAGDSAALRAAAADACLLAAERLVAEGKREEAARLCDAARAADVPGHLRAAATRASILARQSAGAPLLLEQFQTDDAEMFAMALRTSRELPGAEVTQALVAHLDRLPPARQALLIGAIGDRRDAGAAPAIRKRAAGGPAAVRSAAIHALGELGDAAGAAVLIEAAVSGDAPLADAAKASLMKLRGSAADEAVVAKMADAAPAQRAVLLDLVGQLAIPSATPAVLKAADDPDEQVRLAAIKALGRVIGLKEIEVLTERLREAKSPPEEAAVREALKVACLRVPDPEACVGKLLEFLPNAPLASKCFVMELLAALGGTRALKAVSAAADDPREDLQDAATRALGTWTTPDAAPELLRLAKTLPSDNLKTRTLRGYIRIAQQMGLPPQQRLAMCNEAFQAAQRDEERLLVLGVLGQIPAAEAMSMVVPHLGNPALAEGAAAAALAIGEKIVRAEPRAVADAMRQVLKSGVGGEQAARAKKLLPKD